MHKITAGKGMMRNFFEGWFDFQAPLPKSAKVFLIVVAWVIFLLLWEFYPRPESMVRLLPTATDVAGTIQELFAERDFMSDVLASVKRISISFGIAILIALPMGIAMGAFPAVEGFFNPIVSPMRYLPAPSFIPLLLALLGTGDNQKVALLVIGVVWFLISLLMEDAKRVPKELVEASRTLGASKAKSIFTVIIPSASPYFIDTMRQLLAVSWTYLVIAEIVASTDGIGAVMMRARRLVAMDVIMSCILMIGVLGFVSDSLIRGLRWLLFPYLRTSK